MNLDLGPLFAQGQDLVEQAMATGGTRVTGRRGEDSVDIDPDTLVETVVLAEVTVANSVALLVPQGGGPQGQPIPGTPAADTAWRLILPVAVTNVAAGDIYTVDACRDPRLAAGARFKVVAVPDSSAGALRTLIVTKVP
ncbi:MAG TPA: DUF6093 family protein [Dermatophilaceae bacterium]|jgi:hypothetical protein